MKIAMIGQKGIPAKSGGIEKHVEDLAQMLASRGHQVTVYTRPHYTPKQLHYYKGVKLVSLPSIYRKNFDAASHSLLATFHALFKEKPDIIHYHGIGPSLFLWIPRILNPRIRVISTFHCRDYYHQKWSLFARISLYLGEIFSVYLAHKTIAVSEEIQSYIKHRYHRYSDYLPNGIIFHPEIKNSSEENNSVLRTWNLEKKQYIITVSRLIRHKGIHTLIVAYKKIPPHLLQGKKLVIVGAPSFTKDYEKELKDLAKDNPNIIFTGEQINIILQVLLRNAFLFVQPSESEGLSLSLLEALYYKIPILASDIKANLEILKDSGFTFKNKNSEDLSRKIIRILALHQNDLVQKTKNGYQNIQKTYNWAKIVVKAESIYRDVLTKPRIMLRLKAKKIKSR